MISVEMQKIRKDKTSTLVQFYELSKRSVPKCNSCFLLVTYLRSLETPIKI